MDQSNQSNINHGRPLPPIETRWQKGQSGNPIGRPKKNRNMVDLLEELLNAVCPGDPENRTYGQQLMRSLMHQGLKGNLGAIKEILNRANGRVPFPIERIVAPDQSNPQTSHYSRYTQARSRVKLSLERKNEILETLGIQPIGERAIQNETNGRNELLGE